MFKSLSTSLIARGILALAVGVIALAWPSVTVLAVRPVQPHRGDLDAGAGHRAAPHRQDPALRRAGRAGNEGGLIRGPPSWSRWLGTVVP